MITEDLLVILEDTHNLQYLRTRSLQVHVCEFKEAVVKFPKATATENGVDKSKASTNAMGTLLMTASISRMPSRSSYNEEN